MKKVTIFGCGWLGLPLGHVLAEEGYSVIGTITSAEKENILTQNGVKPFIIRFPLAGNAQDFKELYQSDIHIITLPANKVANENGNYPQVIEQICKKIKDFCQNSTIRSGDNPLVVFTSSTSVYGHNLDPISEDCLPSPETSSGSAVFEAENIIKYYFSDSYLILRLAGLIGGDRQPGRFLSGKTNLPNGDLPVNLIQQKHILSICKLLLKGNFRTEVFNVCADEHPTRRQYYTHTAKEMNIDPPQFQENKSIFTQNYKIISNEKLKNRLGISSIPISDSDIGITLNK